MSRIPERDDPVVFLRQILQDDLWPVAEQIAQAIAKPYARVAVAGCHSSSKTHTVAQVVLWFIARYKDGIAITTAPTDRQVQDIMWGEIRSALTRSKMPWPKSNLTKLVLRERNYAEGFTTSKGDEGVRFHGYKSNHLLFVLDEAPGIPPEIMAAIEGAAAGGDVRVVMLGNPTIPGGPFYEAFTRNRETWKTFVIDAFDTPNFAPLMEMAGGDRDRIVGLLRDLPFEHPAITHQPRPYLATPRWAKMRLAEWGDKSPLWQDARARAVSRASR
jgi:hypothetical protein